jgi:glucokinase-like ROK family protein
MKLTGDQMLVKRMNKALVLDTIMQHAPLSRADISAKIGLNKASVSSLVNEWLAEQLVLETGLGESSGGRKPMMLLFNERAGYAVGIDLGVNYISAILTDLTGEILYRKRIDLHTHQPGAVTHLLIQLIHEVAQEAPPSPYGVIGVGIGLPGIVDEQGSILSAPNLGWNGVSLRQLLTETMPVPIMIDNEANVGALGEKQFGCGRTASQLIYISAGIGIGTGLIMNHQIYRGTSGFSGELGHMTIQADGGLLCSCGNRGCWEMYASEQALLKRAVHEIKQFSAKTLDIHALVSSAEANQPDVLRLFSDIGRYLGIGIASTINVFNPEMIIIGNRLSIAKQWLQDSLHESVLQHSLSYHRERVRLEFAALGLDSAALGAASMAISKFFEGIKSEERA